jgi:beta-N-acetylhexosaminidase
VSGAASGGERGAVGGEGSAVGGAGLLLAFEGTVAPPHVLDAVRDGDASGVALYRALNVESPAQLRELGDAVQRAAAAGGQPTAIVAIDQEGGQLMGVGLPATPFGGNLCLAAARSPDLARRVGAAMATELLAMGCTVDWAPDCDLATVPKNPAVGARTFGDDPAVAASLASAFVDGLQGAGVCAALKHFPGGGAMRVDPHDGLAVIGRTADELDAAELAPFRAGIAAGARMVMVSHGAYPALEPDGSRSRPALRSAAILRGVLRHRLGFRGVVVTDALDMRSLDQRAVAAAALDAVDSGVDLLLAGPGQASQPDVMAAIRAGLLGRGAGAGLRIRELRRWLGTREMPTLDVVGCEIHRDLARELAAAAVTVLRDRDALLPLRPSADDTLVVVTPRPADLTPADTSSTVAVTLADAIRLRHSRVQGLETAIDPSDAEVAAVLSAVGAAGPAVVIVGTIDAFAMAGQRELVRALLDAGHRVAVVAMRMPLDADVLPDAGTMLATYSIHAPSLDVASAVLFGDAPAPGRSPVHLATA